MLSTTCEETTVLVAISSSTNGYILLLQSYEQNTSYQTTSFYFASWIIVSGNSHLIFDWLRIGTFQPKFDKNILFFYKCEERFLNLSKELSLN